MVQPYMVNTIHLYTHGHILPGHEKKIVPEADLWKPLERSKFSTENNNVIFLSTFASVPNVTFIYWETYQFSE